MIQEYEGLFRSNRNEARSIASLVFLFFLLLPCFLIAQSDDWDVIDSVESLAFYTFNDIDCAGTSTCAYVADSGGLRSVARVTFDGGGSWQTVIKDDADLGIPYLPPRYLAVAMPSDSTVVILVNDNLIITTQNLGSTWDSTAFDHVRGRLNSLEFANATFGLTAGPRHWSYVTFDGGTTWIRTDSITVELSVKSGHVAQSGDLILLLGRDSIRRMAISNDSGKSWSYREVPDHVEDLDFLDGQVGFGVGGVRQDLEYELDLVVRTTDGGRTWEEVHRKWDPAAYGLRSVSFADASHGLATGGGGKILRSTDGGTSWLRLPYDCDTLAEPCNVGKVVYESLSVAYAIGTHAKLLKYQPDSDVGDISEFIGTENSGLAYIVKNNELLIPTASIGTSTFRLFTIDGRAVLIAPLEQGSTSVSLPPSLSPGNYLGQLECASPVSFLVVKVR